MMLNLLIAVILAVIPTNPNIANRNHYVADVAGKMSAQAVEETNALLGDLRRETTAEMAVLITPSIGEDEEIHPYAVKVFDDWKLGKSDKDNGALLVIDIGGRKAALITGYGLEGVLPDVACKQIIERYVVPNMKRGNVDAAVYASVLAVKQVLTDPAAAKEIRSQQKDVTTRQGVAPISRSYMWWLAGFVAVVALLISVYYFGRTVSAARKLDRYPRATIWHSSLRILSITAIFSCGLALPLLILAYIKYRIARNAPLKCDTCGARMHRLSEQDDNAYLSASQDLEENLGTVDYDVWKCDKCGTIERFPYRQSQMKYTQCPACGTIAYGLKSDRIVTPATHRHEGMGVKRYECLYCGHHDDKNYRIPRKRDDSAAAAAVLGAALGAASRGRGGGFGGGGNIGGGFGGGSTGGGGATGGW